MADRIKRHLSGWRAAALLPVVALVLAALLGACGGDSLSDADYEIIYESILEKARAGEDVSG